MYSDCWDNTCTTDRVCKLTQQEEGNIKHSYTKLNAELYACLIASLANPSLTKVYEFLKLVMEGTRLVKQNNKKSFEMAVRIEKYLK